MAIQALIKAIEGEEIVLKLEDGREYRCPPSLFGFPLVAGQSVWVRLQGEELLPAEKHDILNEIINPHDDDLEKTA